MATARHERAGTGRAGTEDHQWSAQVSEGAPTRLTVRGEIDGEEDEEVVEGRGGPRKAGQESVGVAEVARAEAAAA